MKKPVYTSLGFVTVLRYQQGNQEWELNFDNKSSWSTTKKKAVYVMLSRNTSEILLARWNPKKTMVPRGAAKQKQLVKTWSDWDVAEAWELSIPKKRLTGAGRITRIEYSSDKFDEKGDERGKFHLYRHNFKNVVPFSMSKQEDIFKFKHPRLWNSRGIIA